MQHSAKFVNISLEFVDFRADFSRNFTKSCRINKNLTEIDFKLSDICGKLNSRHRYAPSRSPLLGRDRARVLQAGVSALGGPFTAVSTLTSTLFDFDALLCIFLDLFCFVPHFLHDLRRFLAFIADGHGRYSDLAFSSFGHRCPQISKICRSHCCQRFFKLGNP